MHLMKNSKSFTCFSRPQTYRSNTLMKILQAKRARSLLNKRCDEYAFSKVAPCVTAVEFLLTAAQEQGNNNIAHKLLDRALQYVIWNMFGPITLYSSPQENKFYRSGG